MSAAAQLPRTGFKFMLTVREGPDAGASFQLLPPRVSIGRDSVCNVVLSDPRVSRDAAVIEFSMEQITIQITNNRQVLQVNGETATRFSLKNGDVIRLGESELIFFIEALALGSGGRPLSSAPQIHQNIGFHPPPSGRPTMYSTESGLSKRQKFYLIIIVAGSLLAWLLMSETKLNKKDIGPRTVEEIEKEIKVSGEKSDEIVKKREFKNESEKTRYEEAQRHFSEGFRDFQKNQFARAMKSFETCRTIDPQHQLCMRYFKLSEKSRDSMIAELTLEGRRYREKGMWARCSAQLEKVLDMIQNKDDVKYKSADQLRKECDLRMEERFR